MTDADREGELFETDKSSTKLHWHGRSGIVRKYHPPGAIAPDESHVTVDWLNGHLDLPPGNTTGKNDPQLTVKVKSFGEYLMRHRKRRL